MIDMRVRGRRVRWQCPACEVAWTTPESENECWVCSEPGRQVTGVIVVPFVGRSWP